MFRSRVRQTFAACLLALCTVSAARADYTIDVPNPRNDAAAGTDTIGVKKANGDHVNVEVPMRGSDDWRERTQRIVDELRRNGVDASVSADSLTKIVVRGAKITGTMTSNGAGRRYDVRHVAPGAPNNLRGDAGFIPRPELIGIDPEGAPATYATRVEYELADQGLFTAEVSLGFSDLSSPDLLTLMNTVHAGLLSQLPVEHHAFITIRPSDCRLDLNFSSALSLSLSSTTTDVGLGGISAIEVVPTPGAMALFLAGAAPLAARRRRAAASPI